MDGKAEYFRGPIPQGICAPTSSEPLSISCLIELEGIQLAHLMEANKQLVELLLALTGTGPTGPVEDEMKSKSEGILEKLKAKMSQVSRVAQLNIVVIEQIRKALGV